MKYFIYQSISYHPIVHSFDYLILFTKGFKQALEAINSGHSSKYDYYLNCELLTQANAILASCYVSIVYLSYWSILCPEYVKMAFWGPTDLY